MVDRKDVASWLEGPNAQRPGADTDYPGRRLGMPQSGPGSVGRFGRRLVAILIDWTLCQVIAYAFTGTGFGQGQSGSWWPLLIFAIENVLLLSTLGSTSLPTASASRSVISTSSRGSSPAGSSSASRSRVHSQATRASS